VDPAHTFPSFEVSHLGISTTRGRFERTTGGIVVDEAAGVAAIAIDIDARLVSTGSALVDAWLRSEDFFDVEHYPRIAFRAPRFALSRERPFSAEGELTLLQVTRPVTLRVERFGCVLRAPMTRKTCGADIVTSVSRAAFGMSGFAGLIGDEVRLEIQFEAVADDPGPPPAQTPGGEPWK
jgi:polyisoprenoid-binding protein YceI